VEGGRADGIDGFIGGAAVGVSKGDESEKREKTEHGGDELYVAYRCRTGQELGRRELTYTVQRRISDHITMSGI
jgi:hypothetical protein